MYFLYIDESYDPKSKYVVLGGVIISEDIWKNMNINIINLKKEFFGKDTINLKDIRRKNYDPNNIFNNLSEEEQKEFEKKLYDILSGEGPIYLAALINKEEIIENKRKNFLFRLAYSFLIQRFEYFLREKEGRGMIIMDDSKNEEIINLFEHHREFIEVGIPLKKKTTTFPLPYPNQYEMMDLKNIIENLLFQDDNYSNPLQISDIICAAISANFNRKNDYYYKKIIKNIRKSPDGTILGWGIKIFPEEDVSF